MQVFDVNLKVTVNTIDPIMESEVGEALDAVFSIFDSGNIQMTYIGEEKKLVEPIPQLTLAEVLVLNKVLKLIARNDVLDDELERMGISDDEMNDLRQNVKSIENALL
jgi:hypothetical protein